MKKKDQKLKLHRETLRALSGERLQGVAGGGTVGNCDSRNPCQSISYCYACITVIDPECM